MAIPTVLRRHPIAITIAVIVLLPLVVFALWTTITLHTTYATGTRAGFLQKISRRGWICKTWEGELQLSAIPGSMPEKFIFSVRSDSIAHVLSALNGQHVMLDYEQHKGVPGSCFGDTEYYVTGAHAVTAP
jgi:hypothetical protein